MEKEKGDKGKAEKKNKKKVKEEEESSGDEEDDCCVIDPVEFSRKLDLRDDGDDSDDDVILVAEKGPVALRDFPHPRHLCANFPFNSTDHESYCSKCFCYVCEIAAPCKQWSGSNGHCNVSTKEDPLLEASVEASCAPIDRKQVKPKET